LRDASQTSSDDEVSIASVTLPEDVEAGARHIVDPAPLHRSLVVGDRIVFKFNPPHGEGFGTYVSQGNKTSDRDKSLCKSYDDLDLSQWAIDASKPTLTIPLAHAQRGGAILMCRTMARL
jgi:hypothetical protein